jgi:hypothetical protein
VPSECNEGGANIPTDNVHFHAIRIVKKFCSLNSFAKCSDSHTIFTYPCKTYLVNI